MISTYDMNLIHIFFTFDFQLSSLPYRYDKAIIVFVLTYKIKRHWVKLKSFTSNPIFLPRFIISANKNLKYKEFFSINASTYIPITKHHFKRNVSFINWPGTRKHRLYIYDVLSHQSSITSNSERTPMYVFSFICGSCKFTWL